MSTEIKLTTGERLKDLRKKAGLTSEQLCKEIGEKYGYTITKSKYNQIENDADNDFGFRSFIYLAKFYNVSTDYLLGLSEDKTTSEDEKTALAVTGLKEQSLSVLKKLTCEQTAALDFMLDSRDFIDILELFQHAKNVTSKYSRKGNLPIVEGGADILVDIHCLTPLLASSELNSIYREAIQDLNTHSKQLNDILSILSALGLGPAYKQAISERLTKVFDEYTDSSENV